MDEDLLMSLFPSLLEVSAIAFALFISLPRLRCWLKGEFDRKLASREMRTTEFFTFSYYIAITKYLDFIAILYLIGMFLILLSPLMKQLCTVSYVVILGTTALVLTYSLIMAFASLRKALELSKVVPRSRRPAAKGKRNL